MNLNIDGSAAPNPGVGGCGFILIDNGVEIMKGWIYLGENITNNQAEFGALVHGLYHTFYSAKITKGVVVYTDSELVYGAIKGTKIIRSERIYTFYEAGSFLYELFDDIDIKHIPRIENGYADTLARRAMSTKNSNVIVNEV